MVRPALQPRGGPHRRLLRPRPGERTEETATPAPARAVDVHSGFLVAEDIKRGGLFFKHFEESDKLLNTPCTRFLCSWPSWRHIAAAGHHRVRPGVDFWRPRRTATKVGVSGHGAGAQPVKARACLLNRNWQIAPNFPGGMALRPSPQRRSSGTVEVVPLS